MKYDSFKTNFQYGFSFIVVILIIVSFILNPIRSGIASLIIGSLLLYIFYNEYYYIKLNRLTITRGLQHIPINIYDITLINFIQNGKHVALEITDRQNNVVIVRPVEAVKFTEHLVKINPDIIVQNNLKLQNKFKVPVKVSESVIPESFRVK